MKKFLPLILSCIVVFGAAMALCSLLSPIGKSGQEYKAAAKENHKALLRGEEVTFRYVDLTPLPHNVTEIFRQNPEKMENLEIVLRLPKKP